MKTHNNSRSFKSLSRINRPPSLQKRSHAVKCSVTCTKYRLNTDGDSATDSRIGSRYALANVTPRLCSLKFSLEYPLITGGSSYI